MQEKAGRETCQKGSFVQGKRKREKGAKGLDGKQGKDKGNGGADGHTLTFLFSTSFSFAVHSFLYSLVYLSWLKWFC